MVEFKETPERKRIVEGLEKLMRDAEDVAELMKAQGRKERAHRVLNLAQEASNQRSLIALDWRDEDAHELVISRELETEESVTVIVRPKQEQIG